MQLSPQKVEEFCRAVLREVGSRGGQSVAFSETGVRVLEQHGTRHFPTVTLFLMNYMPELVDPMTSVQLACKVCGAVEQSLVLQDCLKDGRVRRHYAATPGVVLTEALREDQGKLCPGSMQQGILQ